MRHPGKGGNGKGGKRCPLSFIVRRRKIGMRCVEYAKVCMKYALERYAAHGAALSYTPAMRPIYGDADSPDFLAGVRFEKRPLVTILNFLSSGAFTAKFWEKYYGINVSPDALEEKQTAYCSALVKAGPEVEEIMKRFDGVTRLRGDYGDLIRDGLKDGEVALFSPFRRTRDKKSMLVAMAHEAWHLIELERGLFKDMRLLGEGTATCAPAFLLGGTVMESEPENVDDLLYQKAAAVVQRRCNGCGNPFGRMLDPAFRRDVEMELADYTVGTFLRADSMNQEELDYLRKLRLDGLRAERYLRKAAPELAMPENPTRDEIMAYYRRIGANRLADELDGQDLSRLLVSVKSK